MVKFMVNNQEAEAEEGTKLLPFLRDTLNLKSVKNGCSEGACGTCTVIADGNKVKACVIKVDKLAGKSIITVEGLTAREREVYCFAFAEMGAVQCGFCTPGMVISAKALIDQTPDPTLEDVKDAIKNNICRCTGYKKIQDAILLAAKIFRENIEVPKREFKGVSGESMHRVDAPAKVLGTAVYVDDMPARENMLYVSAVRSAYPRAMINSIDTSKAEALPGVVCVLTADRRKGAKQIGHLRRDWDVLMGVGEVTRYLGDAIVLVAAETEEILQKAKSLVEIGFTELTPVRNPQESMAEDAPLIHEEGNLLQKEKLVRGNVDEAIAKAAYAVTDHYEVPFTDHAFLEPECAMAEMAADGTVVIYSSDQGSYQTQRECAEALGIPKEQVRVIGQTVGGGFGGKEDMSVQHHAAMMAYETKRPCKVRFTRAESLLVHVKRHAMSMDYTTACDEDGHITAVKARIIADTGAYASLGGPVLQRACTHAAGPYKVSNIDIEGRAYYTNNPPAGAYRGFGVTQSCFALESNINKMAELVGISPWEIRYRNAVRPGDVLSNGQICDESTGLMECLDAVKSDFDSSPYAGIACAMKNSGLGVGIPDVGRCLLTVKDGKVHTKTAAACIGQGLATVITQLIVDITGISPSSIIHELSDTAIAPNSGNTTASRQTVFAGEAAREAARKLKTDLDKGLDLVDLEGKNYAGEFSYTTDPLNSPKENPVSHIAYGYAAQVVILDENGKLRKVTAAHDVGRAINPISVEGQIEGGVVMSLGYALTEDFPLKDCVPTAKFGMLGLLKATQTPEVKSIIIGKNSVDSIAGGAKGIGEICSIPTAPAVQNAYYRYDHNFRTVLPLADTAYSKKRS